VKKTIAAIAIVAILIGIVVYAYVRQGGSSAGRGAFGRRETSVPVEIVAVTNSDIAKKIVATGAIYARAEVEVYPKQTGELVDMLVDKGDKVETGQTLARIESRAFEIQKKQAEAELAGAKAAYDKTSPLAAIDSETSFKQAKSNLDRLKSVLKQAELDLQLQEKQADVQVKRASADLRIAEARLEAAVSGARDQELEQAKVRTENAKRNLDRMTALLEAEMISKDQVEAAQLQYDIYSAQLSLLKEGARPEDIKVLKAQVETAKASLESGKRLRHRWSQRRITECWWILSGPAWKPQKLRWRVPMQPSSKNLLPKTPPYGKRTWPRRRLLSNALKPLWIWLSSVWMSPS
jgi:multidrug efflux pump subunit AcrA (membrane-fusion protein)